MTNSDVLWISTASGIASGLYYFMVIAYNSFEKIPTIEEVECLVKTTKRKTFLLLRLIFSILTAFIFSRWFYDAAIAGEITKNKLFFYLCVISVSSTILLDISKAIKSKLTKELSEG